MLGRLQDEYAVVLCVKVNYLMIKSHVTTMSSPQHIKQGLWSKSLVLTETNITNK